MAPLRLRVSAVGVVTERVHTCGICMAYQNNASRQDEPRDVCGQTRAKKPRDIRVSGSPSLGVFLRSLFAVNQW